jgi:hypothetical protein
MAKMFSASQITELKDVIDKFGVAISTNPKYVLLGTYYSKSLDKNFKGIIACANNEFNAYALRKEINKSGNVTIFRTEFHETPSNFSLANWKLEMAKKKQAVDGYV